MIISPPLAPFDEAVFDPVRFEDQNCRQARPEENHHGEADADAHVSYSVNSSEPLIKNYGDG